MKPNERIWQKINVAIYGESAGEVIVTIISGLSNFLVVTEVAEDEQHARAHLAAMILSPDNAEIGSLLPLVEAELDRIRSSMAALN